MTHLFGNQFALKHGHARKLKKITPTYYAWIDMRRRCENPNHRAYKWYGARGITVCDRWQSFETFLSDVGEKPEGHSLDRIDNQKGYEPSNCRWADSYQQNANRRTVRLLTFAGKTQSVTAWAQELGMGQSTLQWRMAHGWSTERALTEKP